MTPPQRAMVLAAGLGTRLRPLTETLPKPAVPICGVPPLRWTLAALRAAGVRHVVVNTHWRPEAIRAAVGDASGPGLEVVFSHEDPILGTGGGLKKVEAHFRDATFYLVNGKLLFDCDFAGAARRHAERRAKATMVLRPHPPGSRYGSIGIDTRGRVRRFVDRYRAPEPPDGGEWMFTGVHVLEPAVLEMLPPEIEVCINRQAYPAMLEEGDPVFGVVDEGYFAEPSTPQRYLAAVLDVLHDRVPLDRFRRGGVDPFAGCHSPAPGVFVHPTAEVSPGAELVGPVWLGAGARVEAGAEVGPGVALEAGACVLEGARVVESALWPKVVVEGGEQLSGVIAAGTERVSGRSAA